MNCFGKALVMGAVLSLVCACRAGNSSDLDSSFAIEALQDGSLRDGTVPTLVKLSDWFQKFKVTSSAEKSSKQQVATSAMLRQIPEPYHQAMVHYLDAQIKRNEEFSDALASSDREQIRRLLETEVDEMYDIAGSLLDRNHPNTTGDLFAKFVKLSWRDDFVDEFASDFLASVLSDRLLYEVAQNLSKERDNYKRLLTAKYLDGNGDLRQLAEDLDEHLEALYAMKGAFSGDLNLTGGQTVLSGIPAAFASYSNNYYQSAQQNGYGQAVTPSFLSGITGDNQVSGDQVERVQAISPFGYGGGGGGGGFDPFGPQNGGGGFDPYGPGNGGGYAPGGGGQPIIIFASGSEFADHLAPNWFQSDYQAPNQFRSAGPTYNKPNIDCRGQGFEDRQLVMCQRYLAYAGLDQPRFNLLGDDSGFGLNDFANAGDAEAGVGPTADSSTTPTTDPNAPVSNTKLIREGATRVVDQGSEPSCTAAAMAGSLEAMAKLRGTPKSLDHRILWRAQRQTPMMNASQQAARTAWASQGVRLTEAQPIRSLGQIVDGINAGKVTHLGIDITRAWMAGGGGLEFGLTGGGSNTFGCQKGSGMGHAVSVQGYIKKNNKTFLIIKNSWGRSWGDNGFALVDPVSCLRSADGAVIDATFQ